jgi:hypothetical protein
MKLESMFLTLPFIDAVFAKSTTMGMRTYSIPARNSNHFGSVQS